MSRICTNIYPRDRIAIIFLFYSGPMVASSVSEANFNKAIIRFSREFCEWKWISFPGSELSELTESQISDSPKLKITQYYISNHSSCCYLRKYSSFSCRRGKFHELFMECNSSSFVQQNDLGDEIDCRVSSKPKEIIALWVHLIILVLENRLYDS